MISIRVKVKVKRAGFERKRFKAGLKPNVAFILSIFFFHPSGTRSGANLYLADRLCCSIAFIPGVCRL